MFHNCEYSATHCVATTISVTLSIIYHENTNGGGN